MKEFLYLHKTKITLLVAAAILLLVIIWQKKAPGSEVPFVPPIEIHQEESEEIGEDEGELAETASISSEILIDIKGAIANPGVYEMKTGERVMDAVEKAGGFLEDADTRKVNLAALLEDEMVIVVPKEGEESVELVGVQKPSANKDNNAISAKININTASEEELIKLDGVGPSKAKAIVAYREEKGLFKSVEDLLGVSGIGEKSLEKFRNEITISN